MLIASLAAASNSYRLEAGITLLLGALLLAWEAKAPDSAASIVGASCRCSAAARLAPPLFCSAAAALVGVGHLYSSDPVELLWCSFSAPVELL